jgi:hypothetical protein
MGRSTSKLESLGLDNEHPHKRDYARTLRPVSRRGGQELGSNICQDIPKSCIIGLSKTTGRYVCSLPECTFPQFICSGGTRCIHFSPVGTHVFGHANTNAHHGPRGLRSR